MNTLRPKRFILYILLFLLIGVSFNLIQNIIRYGAFPTYNPIRTIIYLVNAVLLFFPIIPIAIRFSDHIVHRRPYWGISLGLGICTLGVFYLISSLTMYALGYHDDPVSFTYARNYFGRLATWHILTLAATFWYIKYRSLSIKRPIMISGTKGRKTITIPATSVHWIEADDHYVKLHSNELTLLKRGSLKDVADQLQPTFVRIHRKYLVNREEIIGRERHKRDEFVLLKSGARVKIGRSFSENLLSD